MEHSSIGLDFSESRSSVATVGASSLTHTSATTAAATTPSTKISPSLCKANRMKIPADISPTADSCEEISRLSGSSHSNGSSLRSSLIGSTTSSPTTMMVDTGSSGSIPHTKDPLPCQVKEMEQKCILTSLLKVNNSGGGNNEKGKSLTDVIDATEAINSVTLRQTSSCLLEAKTAQFVNDIGKFSRNGCSSGNDDGGTGFGSGCKSGNDGDTLKLSSSSLGASNSSCSSTPTAPAPAPTPRVCNVCHGVARDPYKMTINDGCASGGINGLSGSALESLCSSSGGSGGGGGDVDHCSHHNGGSSLSSAEEALMNGCMAAQIETAANDPLLSGYLGSWKKNRYLSGNFSVSGDTMEAIVQCLVFLKAFSVRH